MGIDHSGTPHQQCYYYQHYTHFVFRFHFFAMRISQKIS